MDHNLTPTDVISMPMDEFEKQFGFRPGDALEKKWFAVTGERITSLQREAIMSGILEAGDLSGVIME